MYMSTYTYSLNSDFGNSLKMSQLHSLIVADGTITTQLNGVTMTGDTIDITFTSGLSGSEESALNSIIAGYTMSEESKVDLQNTGSDNTTYTFAIAPTADRTLTFPDATDTVVAEATTQTLTNKTIDSDTNVITGDKLRTTTGTVQVSSAAAPSSGQVLTATSSTTAVWQTPGGGGGGGISEYHYAESLDTSSIIGSDSDSDGGGAGWVRKLRLTTSTIPAGDYRISWSYNWRYKSTSRDFLGKVLVDGTQVTYHQQEPKDAGNDQSYIYSGFCRQTFGTSGTHDIDIYFNTSNSSHAAYIWNARLELFKID